MLVLFLDWDLEYTGLVMSFGPVPFVPWGTTWRFGKTHNEKASICSMTFEVGVKDAVNSGAGEPGSVEILVQTKTLEKYMEWAAVDTLVRLTKGNIDAAHTS